MRGFFATVFAIVVICIASTARTEAIADAPLSYCPSNHQPKSVGVPQLQRDFNLLQQEMDLAFGRGGESHRNHALAGGRAAIVYMKIEADAKSFAPQVAACLRASEWEYPQPDHAVAKQRVPSDYPDLVMNSLSDARLPAERARQDTALGIDVSGAFVGKWECQWRQDGVTLRFDHHWRRGELCPTTELVNQPVGMGPPGQMDTAAINSFDPSSGRLLGAVGITARGEAQRPHVGYYAGPRRLIWVARENASPLAYSVFVEDVDLSGTYSIYAIGFDFDERSKKISNCRPKAGRLDRPKPSAEPARKPSARVKS